MESVTIAVRVPKKVKERLSRYRIEVSKVVRKALEEEIRKKRLEELEETADRLGELLAKIPDEEIVKSIKETRSAR